MGKIIERVRQREAETLGRKLAILRREHEMRVKAREYEFWQSYYGLPTFGAPPWWAFWRRG